MTLTFLTVLWAAGLVAWLTDSAWPWADGPLAFASVIVAGIGAGMFLCAWT